eukprot:scaffold71902_cov61-Phaeocystis_antarctica.AAC.1
MWPGHGKFLAPCAGPCTWRGSAWPEGERRLERPDGCTAWIGESTVNHSVGNWYRRESRCRILNLLQRGYVHLSEICTLRDGAD